MDLRGISTTRVVPVHAEEFDLFGMLQHVRYLFLVDRALVDFWFSIGYTVDSPDTSQVVRQANITYNKPIVPTTTSVNVDIWTERVGTTSVHYGFSIWSTDPAEPYAYGWRVGVRIDPGTRRPVAWSEGAREDLLAISRADLSYPVAALTPTR